MSRNIEMMRKRFSSQVRSDASQVPNKTSYLYLEYLTEFQSLSRMPFVETISAFNRLVAVALGCFSFTDVCACFDNETRADWSSPEDVKHLMEYNPMIGWKLFPGPITIASRWLGVRPFKSSAWRQRQRYNWVSRLVRTLYFLFNCHVLANLYFQYSLDFDRIKLITIGSKKLQAKQWDETNLDPGYLWELELYEDSLTNRSRETQLMLELIGAPDSDSSIKVECLYLYAILTAANLYYATLFFYSFVAQFDVHIGRELLDGQTERRHFDELMHAQVKIHLESNKMFNETLSSNSYNLTELAPGKTYEYQWAPVMGHLRGNQQATSNRPNRLNQHASHVVGYRQQEARITGGLEWFSQIELISLRDNMARLNKEVCETRKSLNLMLARGALKPFNKAPGHMDRRLMVMAIYHVSIFIYACMLISSLLYMTLSHSDGSRPLGVMDIAFLISLAGLIVICALAANLNTTYFFAGCFDGIVAANKILELIFRCIRINNSEFSSSESGLISRHPQQQQQQDGLRVLDTLGGHTSRMRDPERYKKVSGDIKFGQHKDSMRDYFSTAGGRAYKLFDCRDIVNNNLLFILMQYKIFVAQYLPIKRTFQGYIVFATLFCMSMPIILRIHLTYSNALNVENIKMFTIIWSLGSLIVVDCNVIPMCHLYCRCLDLYRALSSLLAHITTIASDPNGQGLYNQHAISTLVKELEHPNGMMERFETGSLGLSCTYTALIKIHFWWGLIVLSILADKQITEQGLIGSIFRDPFGVF